MLKLSLIHIYNSVLAMFDDVATKYNIEDGHISFNVQPDKSMLSEIEKQNDLKLFELNYKEEDINNLGKTLRIYKQRQEVNTVCLMSGDVYKRQSYYLSV